MGVETSPVVGAGLTPSLRPRHLLPAIRPSPFSPRRASVRALPTGGPPMPSNNPRRVMLLTGASRGIGHATVKRFSSAGWRVITCSRHPFPENCPWEMGPEDHLQVDLADPNDTRRAVVDVKERLQGEGGCLHALVNNAGISPKGPDGARLGSIDTPYEDWIRVFHVNFFA